MPGLLSGGVPLTDTDLLDKIMSQWRPGLYLLNYFNAEVPPRSPLTVELTHFPPRSRYYESFLCTWTFSFTMLLIAAIEYAASAGLRGRLRCLLANRRRITMLQLVLLVVPFQISVLDFPMKSYPTFVLSFNAACLLCYLACLQHKRCHRADRVSSVEMGALQQLEDCSPIHRHHQTKEEAKKRPQFNDLLSVYRSIVYISTAVCIFARDQPCWNNDFSKTYSFGTGLMDVGIGCFIVCIGSLGPTALRAIDSVDRSQAMRKAALQAGILTACGLVKSLAVSLIIHARRVRFDESWREYGVHWNAFYTLAVARLLGAALELLVLPARTPPLLTAAASGALHEAVLWLGLAEAVLAPGMPEPHNRASLIGQNREGLASVPGIVTLYFVGLQLGRWTRDWTASAVEAGAGGRTAATAKIACLLAASLLWRVVLTSSRGLLLPESRRLLSPSYCVWITAFSCYCILFAAMAVEGMRRLRQRSPAVDAADDAEAAEAAEAGAADAPSESLTPIHLRQVDSAGLLYFLVSNLLTGTFNLGIDLAVRNRERLDGSVCFVIIFIYMVTVFYVTRLAESRLSFRALQEKLMALVWRPQR